MLLKSPILELSFLNKILYFRQTKKEVKQKSSDNAELFYLYYTIYYSNVKPETKKLSQATEPPIFKERIGLSSAEL